ncbi:MAG: PAS domain S-box protein [Gammaproteobacteria bacterium]
MHDSPERIRDEALSARQLRRFFDLASNLMCIVDPQGRIDDVNEAVLVLLGYRREQVVGRSMLEFLPEPDRDWHAARHRERTTAGAPPQAVTRIRGADGTVHVIHWRVAVDPLDGRVYAVGEDVTGIRGAHALAQRALASAKLATWVWNTATDAIHWDLTHFSAPVPDPFPATGAEFVERLHPGDRARIAAAMRTWAQGDIPRGDIDAPAASAQPAPPAVAGANASTPLLYTFRFVYDDGSIRWFRSHAYRDALQGVIVGVVRDMSVERSLERRLRDSERRYRTFFENANDGMALIDATSLEIIDSNPAAAAMYAIPRERAIGSAVPAYLRDGQAGSALLDPRCTSATIVQHRPDGSSFPAEVTYSRFEIDGRPVIAVNVRDLSERERADRALRASEARYRAVFENSVNGIAMVDAQTLRLIDANDAFCRAWGMRREAVPGADLFSGPVDRSDLRERLRGPMPYRTTSRHITDEGRELVVDTAVTRASVDGREVIFASFVDITERVRADRALRESLGTLQSTLNSTADAIAVLDAGGALVAWNQKLLSMWEMDAQTVAAGFEERVARAGALMADPEAIDRYRRLLRSDPAIVISDMLRTTDGRILEAYSQPHFIDGQPAGRVWSFRDVTARVESEQHLRITQAALDRAADLAFFVDAGGRVLYANESASRRLGWHGTELLGRAFADIDATAPEAHGTPSRPTDDRVGIERTYRCRDGTLVPVEVNSHRIRYGGSEVQCVFARDITDRHLAAERLRRAAAELALAEERERKDLASALHDTVVQDLALARQRLALMPRPRGARAVIYDDLRAVLDKAVREARTLLFEISPPVLYDLGLGPAIEWLVERFREATGVDCGLHCDGAVASLPKELQITVFQITRELLANVRKHARARRVGIDCASADGTWWIDVADDGIGFDPTATVSAAGEVPFGLYSIRDRLDLIGGRLDIRSAPGGGTRVRVTLPLAGAATAGAPAD